MIDDPLADPRAFDAADSQRVRSFLDSHMPAVTSQLNRHDVCFYTMTPDEHFIVDRHPEHEHLAFVAGLSGHGFKFTSVLGQALADLALEGRTELPIEFLRWNRPALQRG